jgi:hypothetical protein
VSSNLEQRVSAASVEQTRAALTHVNVVSHLASQCTSPARQPTLHVARRGNTHRVPRHPGQRALNLADEISRQRGDVRGGKGDGHLDHVATGFQVRRLRR